MAQNLSNKNIKIWNSLIILFSIIGLIVCISVLFPQVRQMIMNYAEKIAQREASTYQSWIRALLSYAMGGICFILFFNYCLLTSSGRALVKIVKEEIKDCLSEIDFKVLIKPLLFMSVVYLLGILTIIRANFSYNDDIGWAIGGYREWYNWSRYVVVLLSFINHPEIRITDISPLPQLFAVLVLALSSVLLVYILGKKKITTIRLLASIHLGLFPYFLECLSYKFMAQYMAFSIFVCIVPFLFITRKKAFLFVSIISLLVMCMTYQAASGIYMLIAVILCFQYWNHREKTIKEVLSFLGISAFAFCFAMLFFRFFLMKPADYYTSSEMHQLSNIILGTLNNIKDYALTINHDLSYIWKVLILIVMLLFITKSIYKSAQRKILSIFVAIAVIILSFILSFGVYILLSIPLLDPRAMLGFGIFLAIFCVYIVIDYKKIATFTVLALNWCLFVFAFSYGNALADQARYADFRIGILLHDLNCLYPSADREDRSIQIQNSIEFTPTIKNISKNNPVIERLVPRRLSETYCWDVCYTTEHFNFLKFDVVDWRKNDIDFNTLDLPVVLDSYYHTIKSDGENILIVLKH